MSTPLHLALGAIVLAASGVVLAPAACLDRALANKTHERVRIAGAEGRWWRGHGVLVSADGAARMPIAWRVVLAPLVTGTLVVELQSGSDDAIPSGTIAVHRGSLEIRDLHVHAPAALVSAAMSSYKTPALGGDIELRAASFRWRERAGSGAFDATWRRARAVSGELAVDLGVVSASAVPRGDALAGVVRNSGGDVAIDGTLGERAGTLDVALSLKPADSASQALRMMLPLLGASDGAGGVRVTWRSAH